MQKGAFLRHTTGGAIGHSGRNERQLLGTDRNPVPTLVRNVVVLLWALYGVLKTMESLSFDSPVETDVFSMDIYIYKGGGVWVQLLEGQGTCDRVILVLRERIWNAPAVSLVLPAFEDTGSLGSILLVK